MFFFSLDDYEGSNSSNTTLSDYETIPFSTSLSPTTTPTIEDKQNNRSSPLLSNEDKVFLIQQTCTPTKISTQEGFDACYDLCKERKCCFISKENENCIFGIGDYCTEFKECAFVFFEDYDSVSFSRTAPPSTNVSTNIDGSDSIIEE